ncbi:MAG: integrase core domain-containing protein [Pikeienuella sp.]
MRDVIARFRNELLDMEIVFSLREAQILIEPWRRDENTVRPHSALGRRPPASRPGPRPGPGPATIIPVDHRSILHDRALVGGNPCRAFGWP